MTIGERIAKYRQEKGLSQEELAHLLGYKSRSTIYKIEVGQREVPRKMIAQLSIILNVSNSFIFRPYRFFKSRNKIKYFIFDNFILYFKGYSWRVYFC